MDIGFGCEIINLNGQWFRSGVFGKRDYRKLGFTEIEWTENEAFRILKPSKLAV